MLAMQIAYFSVYVAKFIEYSYRIPIGSDWGEPIRNPIILSEQIRIAALSDWIWSD